MVNQNKIFSIKIKCQAKTVFPSDVKRTAMNISMNNKDTDETHMNHFVT